MPGEDHVVVKEETERGAQGEANDVDGDVVGHRRGEPEDVVGEQQAELGDADAAGVREEEEDGLARSIVPRAAAVGPQAVGDPRVQGRGRGGDELRGVGVPGEEAERPVLEQVEQAGVDDVGGGSDHAELDELAHPGEESLRQAQGRGRGRSPVNLPSGPGLGTRRRRVRERAGSSTGAVGASAADPREGACSSFTRIVSHGRAAVSWILISWPTSKMVHMIDTTTREAANASSMNTPPVAPKRYGYRVRDQFGQHFDDPWDWLRDGEDPEVRAHLEAENAWADTVTAPTREAAARLVEEVKASTALTDVTVPIREGEFWYFRRFAEGQSYATHHRAPVERDEAGAPIPLVPEPGVPTPGEELLVDENEWARGQEFFRLADMYPSPDGRLIAWARDTSGDERYTWVVQEASGRVIDEAWWTLGTASRGRMIPLPLSTWAWTTRGARATCGCTACGTPRETDELLLVERTRASRWGLRPRVSRGHVVIHASSSTAGRTWLWLPAHPSVRPLPLMPVRPRTLVSADSAGDRLFIVHTGLTQEGSLAQAMLPEGGSPEALARLGVTSSSAFSRGSLADRTPGTPLPEEEPAPLTPFESWEPLRSPGPGERITDVEAHADYVALSLRSGSLTQVDVWDRREPSPTWRHVEVDAPVRTIATVPTPWEDPLRVEFQSQTVPPTVAEVPCRTRPRPRPPRIPKARP